VTPRPTAPPPRLAIPTEGGYGESDLMGAGGLGGISTLIVDPSPAMQYADFLPRVGAALLDGLFTGLIGCIPAGGIAFVLLAMASNSPESQQAASALVSCCFQIVYQLIALIYFVTLESSTKQGTWGKQIVGIKVTDLAGNRISIGRAFGRYFAKILTGLTCGIGLLMPLFTEKKQTLHDMIAGCLALKK